jgi:hypothetical protein
MPLSNARLASVSTPAALKALQKGFPGKITAWTIEACVGSYPLEVVACSGGPRTFSGILAVSVVSVQVNRIP